jgi:hypothetical protein
VDVKCSSIASGDEYTPTKDNAEDLDRYGRTGDTAL